MIEFLGLYSINSRSDSQFYEKFNNKKKELLASIFEAIDKIYLQVYIVVA